MKTVVSPSCVDHSRSRVNGRLQIFQPVGEHQLASSQPDRAIECAPASQHNYLFLQSGGVGQLPNIFGIRPSYASRRRHRHCTRRAGCNHSRFCPGQFRQPFSCGALQFKHVDKMPGCSLYRAPHLRQFERAAEVGPRSPRVNKWPDPKTGVNVRGSRSSGSRGHRARNTA